MHLYRYKMDGTLVNKVTNGDWAMASSGTGGILGAPGGDRHRREEWLGVLHDAEGCFDRAATVSREDRRQRPDADHQEHGTHRIKMSPDTRYYFDNFSDIKTLPALSLHTSRRQADGDAGGAASGTVAGGICSSPN